MLSSCPARGTSVWRISADFLITSYVALLAHKSIERSKIKTNLSVQSVLGQE